MMAIIECVPNVSEGRRHDVVREIAEAIRQTPGVRLLDYSSDASHNRSVYTFVGEASSLRNAIMALYEHTLPNIDMRAHKGEHPRVGAVDVVPFVPVEDVTLDDCVALAKETAQAVAGRFGVPIYLYEAASANPVRKNLEDIRRGQFEGLAQKMARPGWKPDYGPPIPHASAGVSVFGARMPLVAFNINLATDRLDVAKKIAVLIRQSSGGLPGVKAIGVRTEDRASVQVSINLTDYRKTPIHVVFDAVRRDAERYGVAIAQSEIVGLVPAAALLDAAVHYLKLERFTPDKFLEVRLRRKD